MINPRCAAFKRAILPQLCRVLCDSYTYSDWSPFWNQLKNEQLQTDNYNCQISQIFLFLWAFFNALKDVPGYPISVQGMQESLHSRESNFTNFPGGACPRTPLGVGAFGIQRSCQRRERCTSASWNTASGSSKCYRKPCSLERVFLKRCVVGDHFHQINMDGRSDRRKKNIRFRTETDTCGRGLRLCPYESRYFCNCILFWY